PTVIMRVCRSELYRQNRPSLDWYSVSRTICNQLLYILNPQEWNKATELKYNAVVLGCRVAMMGRADGNKCGDGWLLGRHSGFSLESKLHLAVSASPPHTLLSLYRAVDFVSHRLAEHRGGSHTRR